MHLCCSDYEDLYIQMTASQTKVLIPTLVITYLAGFNFRNFQSSRQNNRNARVVLGGNYDFGTGTQIQDVIIIVFLHFGVGRVFHIIYSQTGCIKLCKH